MKCNDCDKSKYLFEAEAFSSLNCQIQNGILMNHEVGKCSSCDYWRIFKIQKISNICNKNTYSSQKEAEKVAKLQNKNLRIYECDSCRGFHLTSKF